MGNLLSARYGGAAVWNNQLVVVGGYYVGNLVTMEVCDAEQNTWSKATPTTTNLMAEGE